MNPVILGGGYTCSICGQYQRTSAVCHHDNLLIGNTKFKVGDKLEAGEYDKEQYGLKYVTITSINEETKVYHWDAKCEWGKIHSGYFFHEAKEYKEKD